MIKQSPIQVLQIGCDDWKISSNKLINWTFFNSNLPIVEEEVRTFIKSCNNTFDAVLVTDKLDNNLILLLSPLIEVYTLIIDEQLISDLSEELKQLKLPISLNIKDRDFVVKEIQENFFSGQMGSKLHTNMITTNKNFSGKIEHIGQTCVKLTGDFEQLNKTPIITWQSNIGVYKKRKKIWLEFTLDKTVNLIMKVYKIIEGTSKVLEIATLSQEEFKSGFEIPYEDSIGYISIALIAEGKGSFEVGPLHYRDSRKKYGEYIVGGKKIIDYKNQEIFYYFNPGDCKPPLNVYFSGYRSAEGFEGFYMMKRLGAPFLLITDPRLEGGSFYMGSQKLEQQIVETIKNTLKELRFRSNDLILSGLSMGTFGALYYASLLNPSHVIIGKPLVNIGNVALNEELVRPGGFPTSLDILRSLSKGELNIAAVKSLNSKFWKQFKLSEFSNTTFIISYMIHDDYDADAYKNIIEALSDKEASVIGKGIPGRHNDNSQAINEWFINNYRRVLLEKFDRKGVYEG